MDANDIESIYTEYRKAVDYSPEYTLAFFSKHLESFNTISYFNDEGQLHRYVELVWQYLNASLAKRNFKISAQFSEKYLRVIDLEIERLNISEKLDDWYFDIQFFNGMSHYHLKKYRKSTRIFERLIHYRSSNETYINWLNYSRFRQRIHISKTITITCYVLMLIELSFKGILNPFLRMSIVGIALIGLIGSLIYDYYYKARFKDAIKKGAQ